jgi:AraC-like DNA-binding protein
MNNIILPEIVTCGYFDCVRKFGSLKQSPKRTAANIEIELFLEDGRSTYIDGREFPVLKNHIVISKKGTERYSKLPFKTVFIKLSATGDIADALNGLPVFFMATHAGQMIELFNDIILLHEEQNTNRLLLGAKILLLIELLRQDSAIYNANAQTYSMMHEAKKYINKNFSQSITATDIAASVNLSESRFRFLFKKTYGISAHRHLMNVRIAAAKQMLWDGVYSASEIAEKCGFGSQQYFNDCFKRETGLSPGRYKDNFERKYSNG